MAGRKIEEITSITELQYAVESGVYSLDELRKAYTRSRRAANEAIRRIQRSDVYFRGEKPEFTPPSQLKDPRALYHEMADLARFRASDLSTVTKRKRYQDEQLAALHAPDRRGVTHFESVNKDNFYTFVDFMEWFRASGLNKLYSSKDERVEDFFEEYSDELQESDPEGWEDLFFEYMAENEE